MIDTNEIKAYIARKGVTQEQVAKACGMASRTFYRKMKMGVFGTDEVELMIKYLGIKNPGKIFFAKKVTPQVTERSE